VHSHLVAVSVEAVDSTAAPLRQHLPDLEFCVMIATRAVFPESFVSQNASGSFWGLQRSGNTWML
jgi:hypothetical protein